MRTESGHLVTVRWFYRRKKWLITYCAVTGAPFFSSKLLVHLILLVFAAFSSSCFLSWYQVLYTSWGLLLSKAFLFYAAITSLLLFIRYSTRRKRLFRPTFWLASQKTFPGTRYVRGANEWKETKTPKPTNEHLENLWNELLKDDTRKERYKSVSETEYTALTYFPNQVLYLEYRQ